MNFRHLVKVTSRILHGKYSAYSRLTLFGIYCRLIFKAFLHYKFEYQGKYGLEEEIFGFHIHFHSYSELINLFEEIFIFEVYRNTRRDAELIIDGGSNIGLSVIYFRMIFPRSEIIAFEPQQQNFNLLIKNIQLNKLSNVSPHKAALGPNEELVELTPAAAGSLNWTLSHGTNFPGPSQPVKAVRLSQFIKRDVSLLKLDIEGLEGEVLAELAMADKLMRISSIILEYHPTLAQSQIERIVQLLKSNNFEINLTLLSAAWQQRSFCTRLFEQGRIKGSPPSRCEPSSEIYNASHYFYLWKTCG